MRAAQNIVIALLIALLLAEAAFSLRWPITHDEAPLFYEAFLMQAEGRVPYRDIVDFQMPGSYAAFYALGLLSGFDGFRLRLIDLFLLAIIIVITYLVMRGFGRMPALSAGLLFGLKYLQGGPSQSLQREYLLLIFVGLGVYISLRDHLTPATRTMTGFFFGLAATLKPHAAIGLLPILLFDILGRVDRRNHSLTYAALGSLVPAILGFLVPVSLMALWLALSGALPSFIDIATNYWPLYAQVNGQMAVNSGAARWGFILDQIWRLGGNGIWLLPAIPGIYLASRQVHLKNQVYVLAGLTFCYAIYPALSGQFFPYHYLPFVYFILMLAALCLMEAQPKWQAGALIIFVGVIALNIRLAPTVLRQLEGKPIATSTDRADEIARYLKENLAEEDTVQPLDWTGGTLLAMLEARAHLATPYVFDFYFYHHVSEPYIQNLRVDFMKDLQAARPGFIVEVTAIDKPWIAGEDTSHTFPELRAFLEKGYSITIQKDGYVIYKRR
jgi:hypothetical protein